MVFQDEDNFTDNPLVEFAQFRNAKSGPLMNGKVGQPLDKFYEGLKNGTLPEISYIIGPANLSEHNSYGTPLAGGYLQDKIARAVIESPLYNKTALIISYDETGGFFDHVIPYTSPIGTSGEWFNDTVYNTGYTFSGPGLRVPMYIISPWTRNGGVYTEHADHTSQLLFIEKWQAAKGKNVTSNEVVPWRRQNMADLTNAFDFDNPNYDPINLPNITEPALYDSTCPAGRKNPTPPAGGNGISDSMGSLIKKGFKTVRGSLTEGRYLALEMGDFALSHAKGCKVTTTIATKNHNGTAQQWVIDAVQIGGPDFTVRTSNKTRYICDKGYLCRTKSNATVFTLAFTPGKGHTFKVKKTGTCMVLDKEHIEYDDCSTYWKVYSVNY